MKLKGGFVQKFEEQRVEEAKQAALHEKYGVEDQNVRVVEKTNTFKFLIRTAGNIAFFAFRIVGILLAATGVLALIYPESRGVLAENLQETLIQTLNLLGIYDWVMGVLG